MVLNIKAITQWASSLTKWASSSWQEEEEER